MLIQSISPRIREDYPTENHTTFYSGEIMKAKLDSISTLRIPVRDSIVPAKFYGGTSAIARSGRQARALDRFTTFSDTG